MRGDGIRYQGALVREGRLLLIQYQPRVGEPFWMFPGGGRESETPEECVAREMFEETSVRVEVERQLLDQAATGDRLYRTWRTYLCSADQGEPRPGSEPGNEHLGFIRAVGWFDLALPDAWDPSLVADPITFPQVVRIRARLGYR